MQLQACLTALDLESVINLNTLIFFGFFIIVVASLNLMYGYAGLPFLGGAAPMLAGGIAFSAITTRLTFLLAQWSGASLQPYSSEMDWVYNSQHNVKVVNIYLETRPILCITLIVFSIAIAMLLGAVAGWIISRPAIHLKPQYFIISNLCLVLLAEYAGTRVVLLSGGYTGVYVPELLAFYGGDRRVAMVVIALSIASSVLLLTKHLRDSPYGRLLVAIRDNEVAAASLGKNTIRVKESAILVGSSLMATAGVLLAVYYAFVVQANYHNSYWGYWPMCMLIVGGAGNDLGVILGVLLIQAVRWLPVVFRDGLSFLFFPVAYMSNIILALCLLLFLILRPKGILKEKTRPINVKNDKNYAQLSDQASNRRLCSHKNYFLMPTLTKTRRNQRTPLKE